MEAGMSGVVYCGSMGDWVLLTDDQCMKGVEALVGAGIPLVVGTGALTPALACAHAAHAADAGASGLMVIPRCSLAAHRPLRSEPISQTFSLQGRARSRSRESCR